MRATTILTIVTVVAALGMLGIATEMMTAPQAHAARGGSPGCAFLSKGFFNSGAQCFRGGG